MKPKHIEKDVVLYVDGVSVSFDGFKALNNLSLILNRGEMRAIIGPNGAGKTTMMDVITGKTRPDEGVVEFDGSIDLTKHDEAQIANLGIGRKFQKPSVIETLTVYENLELAITGQRGNWANLFFKRSAAQSQRIDELLALVRLQDQPDTVAGSLSHGQKQWLEIGMLLAQEPKVLLIDEPAAGMTDAETERTAELFKELAQHYSLVVVEHDMTFIRALNCKVTVLHEGSVLAEGTLDQVQKNQKVIDVYLGR
ncbi:MAG: urea ABC transporter ATP-binding protein UrtD [Marinobacter sp.]|nr:urea ABC transporter ATP-binding protein UrtD [Marinobacter sp.]